MRRLCLLSCLLAACTAEPSQAPPTPAPPSQPPSPPPPAPSVPSEGAPFYDVPERSDAALQDVLVERCREARGRGVPMLVEWTAPWCKDCVELHRLKQQAPLQGELARWPYVSVNVGRFDRHRALLRHFGVKAIANWTVLAPERCDAPPTSWAVRAQRTLEPVTGEKKGVDPAALAAWLARQRG